MSDIVASKPMRLSPRTLTNRTINQYHRRGAGETGGGGGDGWGVGVERRGPYQQDSSEKLVPEVVPGEASEREHRQAGNDDARNLRQQKVSLDVRDHHGLWWGGMVGWWDGGAVMVVAAARGGAWESDW